jgi:hypothetical protein
MFASYFALNTIYCANCEIVQIKLPDEPVDLIYADQPTASNKQPGLNTREENAYPVNAWTKDGKA